MNNSQTEIVVIEWRPLKKGASLQGFVTLQLPSGLIIRDVTYHCSEGGARWVGMPARQYTRPDSSTSWVPMVSFVDKSAERRFRDLALKAIDAFFGEQQPKRNASAVVHGGG